MADPVQTLFADPEFRTALERVDRNALIASAAAFGTAANAIHQLGVRERQLIFEKRRMKGASPKGEREYARDYKAFANGEMAAAISAGKVVLKQLVQSGLNEVLSRHVMTWIKDGKAPTSALRAAAIAHLGDKKFSFLTEHCGFNTQVTSLVWNDFVNIATDVPIDVLLPGQIPRNPGSVGSGVSVSGPVVDIPINKGVGLALSDLIYLATTSTTDYTSYLETAGVPMYGNWLNVSATQLGAGSETLTGMVVFAICVVGAGIFQGTIVGAVCEIIGIGILLWLMGSLPCGGPASFVDP
jgi:hypothetical protein